MHSLYDKIPAIIYDNHVFTPQEKTRDNLDRYTFMYTIEDITKKDLLNVWDAGLFLPNISLTQKYQHHKQLLAQRKDILPLLRNAIVDIQLPTRNHFPLGKEVLKALEGNNNDYTGRQMFVQWIGQLRDYDAIPQLQQILSEEDKNYMNDDYTYIIDTYDIKHEALKTLLQLGRKDIVMDYIYDIGNNGSSHHIKDNLILLKNNIGLTNADLPKLLRLAEQYESMDSIYPDLDKIYLHSFLRQKGIGSHDIREDGRVQEYHHESNIPIQLLILQCIARIGTIEAYHVLDNLLHHTVYQEFQLCCISAIRYFVHMLRQKQLVGKTITLSEKVLRDIEYAYIEPSVDAIITSLGKAPYKARTGQKRDIDNQRYQKSSKEWDLEMMIKSKLDALAYQDFILGLQVGDTVDIDTGYLSIYRGTINKKTDTMIYMSGMFGNTFLEEKTFTMKGISQEPAIKAPIQETITDDSDDEDYQYCDIYYHIVQPCAKSANDYSIPLIGKDHTRDPDDLEF